MPFAFLGTVALVRAEHNAISNSEKESNSPFFPISRRMSLWLSVQRRGGICFSKGIGVCSSPWILSVSGRRARNAQ